MLKHYIVKIVSYLIFIFAIGIIFVELLSEKVYAQEVSENPKLKLITYEELQICKSLCENIQDSSKKIFNIIDKEKEVRAKKENDSKKEVEVNNKDDTDGTIIDFAYLNVLNIEQNPELPTGCEVVAATIVLNYYGANLSKTELVDKYLPYSDSPYNGFVGSPYEQPTGHGHWCTASPIVIAMNNAIQSHQMECVATNISGTSFDGLLNYVAYGKPIVFWGYENMARGYHTLVLIGYDKNEGVCYFADPLKSDIQTYNIEDTKRAYLNRGKQAIIVQ